MLLIKPTQEEVKRAVFDINLNNSAGLDGFSSLFFQYSWDIIGLIWFN